PTGLRAEHNALRYHCVPVTIRYDGGSIVHLVRVVAAGARAGSPMTVSSGVALPGPLRAQLRECGATLRHDDRQGWRDLARELAREGGRVRLVGGPATEVIDATEGSPALTIYASDVVSAGRV